MSSPQYEREFSLEKLGRFAQDAAKKAAPGKPVSVSFTVKSAQKRLGFIRSVMQYTTAYAEAHVSHPAGSGMAFGQLV